MQAFLVFVPISVEIWKNCIRKPFLKVLTLSHLSGSEAGYFFRASSSCFCSWEDQLSSSGRDVPREFCVVSGNFTDIVWTALHWKKMKIWRKIINLFNYLLFSLRWSCFILTVLVNVISNNNPTINCSCWIESSSLKRKFLKPPRSTLISNWISSLVHWDFSFSFPLSSTFTTGFWETPLFSI